MTIKFVKRAAGEILGRGETSIRLRATSLEEAKKALTRDDVRKLIKDGSVFAIPERQTLSSARARQLKIKREKGRRRGIGRRKGTAKARAGRTWEKKVRSQRLLLKRLKEIGKVDRKTFRRFYGLIKGNIYPDKRSLMLHLEEEGVKIDADELKQINEYIKGTYR